MNSWWPFHMMSTVVEYHQTQGLKFAVSRYPRDAKIWLWIPNCEWLTVYPNWILRKFQTLIAFEYCLWVCHPNLSSYNVHFCVLMNCLVVDNLSVESPVVIAICNSESYWMGQGIILMVTSIQKWDTAFSGGILNFESWYPSWILKIYLNFRSCQWHNAHWVGLVWVPHQPRPISQKIRKCKTCRLN
jgi:hypothetical protein